MKKRLIKKVNKRRIENILNKITSNNFNITNKVFGNGYFIFSFGENTVCHFTLKETPLWKYGIWLDGKNGFQIFGEHEWLIDKFKPSRTYLSYNNDINGFLQEVKLIRLNSKLYFVDSLTDGDALFDYEKEDWGDGEFSYKGYQAIREYNEETKLWDKFRRNESITQEEFVNSKYDKFMKTRLQEEENKEFDRVFAFNFFKELPNLFSNIEVVGVHDRDKNEWKCSPRYDIKVLVSKDLSNEEVDKLYDELDELVNSKNNSEEKKSYEHGFLLMGCYDDIRDLKNCDYRYCKS